MNKDLEWADFPDEDSQKFPPELRIKGDTAKQIAKAFELCDEDYEFAFSVEMGERWFSYEAKETSYEWPLVREPIFSCDIKKRKKQRQEIVEKLNDLGLSDEEIDILNYQSIGAHKRKKDLKKRLKI